MWLIYFSLILSVFNRNEAVVTKATKPVLTRGVQELCANAIAVHEKIWASYDYNLVIKRRKYMDDELKIGDQACINATTYVEILTNRTRSGDCTTPLDTAYVKNKLMTAELRKKELCELYDILSIEYSIRCKKNIIKPNKECKNRNARRIMKTISKKIFLYFYYYRGDNVYGGNGEDSKNKQNDVIDICCALIQIRNCVKRNVEENCNLLRDAQLQNITNNDPIYNHAVYNDFQCSIYIRSCQKYLMNSSCRITIFKFLPTFTFLVFAYLFRDM